MDHRLHLHLKSSSTLNGHEFPYLSSYVEHTPTRAQHVAFASLQIIKSRQTARVPIRRRRPRTHPYQRRSSILHAPKIVTPDEKSDPVDLLRAPRPSFVCPVDARCRLHVFEIKVTKQREEASCARGRSSPEWALYSGFTNNFLRLPRHLPPQTGKMRSLRRFHGYPSSAGASD